MTKPFCKRGAGKAGAESGPPPDSRQVSIHVHYLGEGDNMLVDRVILDED